MDEIALYNRDSQAPQASWLARCAAALVLGGAFWLVGHSFTESRTIRLEGSVLASRVENRYATQQKATNVDSAVGYFLVGGLGLWCGATAVWRRLNLRHLLIGLCLAYLLWCGMSLLWSAEPSLSVRKLAILGLMYAGAFGLAARFKLEDILWIAVLTLAGYVALGVAAEIACGTFRPWRSDYRFAGTCHPNDQGLQCALLALAAAFLTWRERHRPWLQAALVGAGLLGMAMTKSRTALAAAVAALALALVLRSHGLQRWLLACVGVATICIAGIAMSFGSVASINSAVDAAAMGRRANVGSLSGRLPLWKEAWQEAEDRLLLGYGYGAFWGEKNVLKFSKRFAWHIPHAHNAYLDHVLATGLVGGALYVLWVTATAMVTLLRAEQSRRPAEFFVVCLIAFSLVHGLSESKLPSAGVVGFVLLAGIAAVTIQRPRPSLAPAIADSPARASTAVRKLMRRPVSRLTGRPMYAPAPASSKERTRVT